jgi:hypothetical protein
MSILPHYLVCLAHTWYQMLIYNKSRSQRAKRQRFLSTTVWPPITWISGKVSISPTADCSLTKTRSPTDHDHWYPVLELATVNLVPCCYSWRECVICPFVNFRLHIRFNPTLLAASQDQTCYLNIFVISIDSWMLVCSRKEHLQRDGILNVSQILVCYKYTN